MKYKYLLFDLDGTLVNTEEGIVNCVIHALSGMGITVSDKTVLRCFIGPPIYESFEKFCNIDKEEAKKAVAVYRERYKTLGVYECTAYEGIADTLKILKNKGYVLGVATSKPEVFANKILEKEKLSQYFDCVTGATLDGTRDAKTLVIKEALKRMNIKSDELDSVLMIGDRLHDIIGAKECGIDCMGVRYGFAKEGELTQYGANIIVDTTKEIAIMLD